MYDNHTTEKREGSPGEAEFFAQRYAAGANAYRYYEAHNAVRIGEGRADPSTPERFPGYPYDFKGASPVRTSNPDLVIHDRNERQHPYGNKPDLPAFAYAPNQAVPGSPDSQDSQDVPIPSVEQNVPEQQASSTPSLQPISGLTRFTYGAEKYNVGSSNQQGVSGSSNQQGVAGPSN